MEGQVTNNFWDSIIENGNSDNSTFWNSLAEYEIANKETEIEKVESIDAELDLQLAQNLAEVVQGMPTDEIETTYGLCKVCEYNDGELANGLCVDCWDGMVDIMPHFCTYDPSLDLWIEYGKPVLA